MSAARKRLVVIATLLLALLLTGCALRRRVIVHVDGKRYAFSTEAATVGEALEKAGIVVGPLDRVEPKPWEEIGRGATIIITRVSEKQIAESRPLPYSRQQIQDEALRAGVRKLIQLGINGTEILTYSIRYEEGRETSRRLVARQTVATPQPEIVVEGVQGALPRTTIRGTVAYISNGNAWVVYGSTDQKRPLTFSGDLDGRVFALSPDGRWLLFTRRPLGGEAGRSGPLNTLWVVNTRLASERPRSLDINGVLHAEWAADSSRIAYTTAERAAGAPGWKARNDLWIISLHLPPGTSEAGPRGPATSGSAEDEKPRRLVSARTNLPYAWWGMEWAWSPDGTQFAYAQADEVGVYDLRTQKFNPLIRFAPYRTYGSWVWVPHVAWSPGGQLLAVPIHLAPDGTAGLDADGLRTSAEDSPRFGLALFRPARDLQVLVADKSGMWAWPSWSPDGQLAFGMARQPTQSDRSVYDLYVMDADGSNRRRLFPPEGARGLDLPEAVWSPSGDALTLTWQNDIFLVDARTGRATRLTANGRSSHARWAR